MAEWICEVNNRLMSRLTRDPVFGLAVLTAPMVLWGMSFVLSEQNWEQRTTVQQLLLLILVYPLLEEIVFRGWLQDFLKTKGAGGYRYVGLTAQNVITSVVFVLFHFIHHPWYWALSVFIPSLVFGYFKDRYQQLTPSILLHIYYNGLYFLT